MGRFVAGAVLCLLLVSGGLFWWQERAESVRPVASAAGPSSTDTEELPLPEGDDTMVGTAPPMPPEAPAKDREAKRFDRYDRNRDNVITRTEMMSSRAAAFRKLDKDGNNLLSFEEWAVATSDRFAEADANKDGKLTRAEFATTAPKAKPKPKCKC